MVDPYLSNSVAAIQPQNERRVSVDERFFDVTPDLMLFTHNHLDHYDPETVARFLQRDGAVTVLSPSSVWERVRAFGGRHRYLCFDRHAAFAQNGIALRAVKACHTDPMAIGVLLEAEGKTYYLTGDTVYREELYEDLPSKIDVLFLPVNGIGNNMNMEEAAVFADRLRAEIVVPLHIGMFDSLSADDFACDRKRIPEIYKEILL